MTEQTEPTGAPEPAEARSSAQGATPEHAQQRPRRRGLVLGIVGAVVLVAAGVTAAVLATREPTAPVTPPAVTITNPVPTPAATPVEREESTPLAAALPDTVLQWAYAGIEEEKGQRGALETYRVTYVDGAGGKVALHVTQLRDAEAAASVAAGLADAFAALNPDATTTTLPVTIGGEAKGEATIRTLPSASGAATWVNGTVVLHAEGPADEIEDFFRAFPL